MEIFNPLNTTRPTSTSSRLIKELHQWISQVCVMHGKTVQRLKEKFLFKVIVSEKEEVKERSTVEKIQALIRQTLQRDLKELEQSLIMIKQQEAYMEQKTQNKNSARTIISDIEESKKRIVELENEREELNKENEVLEKNYTELSAKLTEINEAMNLLEDTNKELLERSELCETNNENLTNKVVSLETEIKLKDEALVKAQKVIEELYKELVNNTAPELEKPQTTNQYTETINTPTSNKETNTEIFYTSNKSVITDRVILSEEIFPILSVHKQVHMEDKEAMTEVMEEKLIREFRILKSEREVINEEIVRLREEYENNIEVWKQAAINCSRSEINPIAKCSIIMTTPRSEDKSLTKVENHLYDPLMSLVIDELEKATTEIFGCKSKHIKELESILKGLIENVKAKESKEDVGTKGMCAILFELFKLIEEYNKQTQTLRELLCDKKETITGLSEENERLRNQINEIQKQFDKLKAMHSAALEQYEELRKIVSYDNRPEEIKERLELLVLTESECKNIMLELKQYNGLRQAESKLTGNNVITELHQQILILKTQLEVNKTELINVNKEMLKYNGLNEQKEIENKLLTKQIEELNNKLTQKKKEESKSKPFTEKYLNIPIDKMKVDYESNSTNKADFSITICSNCDTFKSQLHTATTKLEKYKQKFQKRVKEFDSVLQYVMCILNGTTENKELITKITQRNENVNTWLNNIKAMISEYRTERQRYKDFLLFVLNLLEKTAKEDRIQRLINRNRYGKSILEVEKVAAEGLQEFFRAHSKCPI